MGVDNLVFNRLGNSFSALLSSEEENIQVWDRVKFNHNDELFAVSTTPFNFLDKNVFFSLILKNGNNFHSVYFYGRKSISVLISKNINFENYFKIKEPFLEAEHRNDFFELKGEQTELLFNLSMKNLNYIKIKEGKILIPKENMLRAILEIM